MYQFLMAILLGGLACSSYASVETVSLQLKQKYPNLKIENIQKTPTQGLYSATLENKIIYVDESAENIFVGSMIRLKDQRNLTKDLVLQQQRIDWNKLPLQNAIKVVKGQSQRKLAVFTDPNCPYCKQLEFQLDQLDNVTLYIFVYPIRNGSLQVAKQVWCEPNRAYAWKNLIEKGVKPQAKASCNDPMQSNLTLGQQLGVEGTPTLFFSNGFKAVGVQSKQQIEKLWQEFDMK